MPEYLYVIGLQVSIVIVNIPIVYTFRLGKCFYSYIHSNYMTVRTFNSCELEEEEPLSCYEALFDFNFSIYDLDMYAEFFVDFFTLGLYCIDFIECSPTTTSFNAGVLCYSALMLCKRGVCFYLYGV